MKLSRFEKTKYKFTRQTHLKLRTSTKQVSRINASKCHLKKDYTLQTMKENNFTIKYLWSISFITATIKTIYKKTKLYKIVKNSKRYCLLAAFCQFHHNAIKIILNLKNDLGSSEAERKIIHKYRKTREKVKKKIYGKIKQY